MTKKKIHQVYFENMVGTWKTVSINGQPTSADIYLKFFRDCTFDGSLQGLRGTVNGDVEEIAVDGDGTGHDGISLPINGRAVLIESSEKSEWQFSLRRLGGSVPEQEMSNKSRPRRRRYNELILETKGMRHQFALERTSLKAKYGQEDKLAHTV